MNPAHDVRAWRRIAIGSFLTLLCVTLAWNAAAYVIDESGLDADDSWPMVFGSVIATIFYATTPLALSLVAAVVAAPGTGAARPAAWCGVAIDVVCAAALLLASGLLIGESPAEVAFAVVSALLALVLLAPGVLSVRQARTERGHHPAARSATRRRG